MAALERACEGVGRAGGRPAVKGQLPSCLFCILLCFLRPRADILARPLTRPLASRRISVTTTRHDVATHGSRCLLVCSHAAFHPWLQIVGNIIGPQVTAEAVDLKEFTGAGSCAESCAERHRGLLCQAAVASVPLSRAPLPSAAALHAFPSLSIWRGT